LAVLTSPATQNERCSWSVQYEPANLTARLWNGGRGFGGPGLQRDPPHSLIYTTYGEEKHDNVATVPNVDRISSLPETSLPAPAKLIIYNYIMN
jgi:hypothetical protein